MTNLQKALSFIQKAEISNFFAFMDEQGVQHVALERLRDAFLLGKTDVDFYQQLETLARTTLNNTAALAEQAHTTPTRDALLSELQKENGVRQVLKILESHRASLSAEKRTVLNNLKLTEQTARSLYEKATLAKDLQNFVEDLEF